MALRVQIDPTDPAPIWRQIEEQVRQLVGAGVVAPAAPLPSVRDLARALRVNPATVAKAYQRLCEQGVLEVRRGEGTFVAAHVPRQDEARRRELLAGAARRYVAAAAGVGASQEEAVTSVRAAWADGLAGERGEG
ncbi:MAG: GntR family transcriptional regulator [Acidobacteriota bacterium]